MAKPLDNNPFERWGLDPGDDLRSLTRAMRETIAAMPDDERQQLQKQWRELTSDPVQRARWIALTPPQIGSHSDPWTLAEALITDGPTPKLEALEPTIDDALALPLMTDEQLQARPPFLPTLLRDERRRKGPRRVVGETTAEAPEEEDEKS